jgi:hypothetical protein
MARTPRDLSTGQVFWLAGACGVFLAVVAIAALITVGVASVENSRQRQAEARHVEPRPPIDLNRVPELVIEPIEANGQARVKLAQLVRDIRQQNQREEDGFVKKLVRERTDLQGLPFQMGHKCRMDALIVDLFASAVGLTHETLRSAGASSVTTRSSDSVEQFWTRWNGQDAGVGVAALTQIYGPQTAERRENLASRLNAVDHPASTRALARAAVFDFDKHVRIAAVKGLKNRAKEDYTEILMAGLGHPWEIAARNAAVAIGQLQRQDLVPQLVAFLSQPDPREPYEEKVNGEPVTMVRELVKLNHHRNCLLCHPPPDNANQMPGGVFAVVPTPGESFPMPSPGNPYGSIPSEVMVRADVTYLRQDFSIMQSVGNAHPWPEMQRFDFFVRTRTLNADQVKEHQKRKAEQVAAAPLSANHKAAIEALQRLTGKENVEPTAEAWAAALDLPVPQVVR